MLYVLALVSAFASFWFIVAALQTFQDAQPARPTNILLAIVTALLAAGLFWLGRRLNRGTLACLAAALLAAGIAGGVLGSGQVATAAGEQIVVTTDPPIGEIHPHGGPSADVGPDKFIIEVKDGSGRTLPNVKLDVTMDAPETNWFISTDVPRIEGVQVLNWSGVAPDGRQEFSYIFPIRGTYHLTIKASPAPGSATTFSPVSKDAELHVTEKPRSVLYLLLFLAALFTFGAISGVVLGRANFAGRRAA